MPTGEQTVELGGQADLKDFRARSTSGGFSNLAG